MPTLPRAIDGLREFVRAAGLGGLPVSNIDPNNPGDNWPLFDQELLHRFATKTCRCAAALALARKEAARPISGPEEALLQLWAVDKLLASDPQFGDRALTGMRTRSALRILTDLKDVFYSAGNREVLIHGLVFSTPQMTIHTLGADTVGLGGNTLALSWDLIINGRLPDWLSVFFDDLWTGTDHFGELKITIMGAPTSCPFLTEPVMRWLPLLAPFAEMIQLFDLTRTDPYAIAAAAGHHRFLADNMNPLGVALHLIDRDIIEASADPARRARLNEVRQFVDCFRCVEITETAWLR